MKILSIGSDRKVFEEGSAVRARLLDYGSLVDELHVIVFAKRSAGFHEDSFPPNIFLYPTNSLGKFFHIPYAIIVALKLKRRGVVIDVVTTQDPFEAGLVGYFIARIFNARLHIQIHTDVMSLYFLKESVLNRARVFVSKILIPRANAIRVVSERIKRSIEGIVLVGTQITVLPIYIETKKVNTAPTIDLKKKYPQFDFHILTASRLSPEKNIKSIIKALQSVVAMHPRVGLVIIGSGPEQSKLKKLSVKLGVKNNVVFEGWQGELSGYYKTANVFILASFYEGYGMVVVEALSAGCPVIMTDVGCAGTVVKDGQNGLIVPVNDTNALALAIKRVVSGGLKFDVKRPNLPTKEEYLAQYKKSWEEAFV